MKYHQDDDYDGWLQFNEITTVAHDEDAVSSLWFFLESPLRMMMMVMMMTVMMIMKMVRRLIASWITLISSPVLLLVQDQLQEGKSEKEKERERESSVHFF